MVKENEWGLRRVITGMKGMHTAIVERLDCRASQIVRFYNLFEARPFALSKYLQPAYKLYSTVYFNFCEPPERVEAKACIQSTLNS